MKGQNEFVYFLVGGLIILAILLAFFGTDVYKIDNRKNQTQGIIEAIKTFTIPDFTVSNMLERKSTEIISKRIYNGLLFGEDKIIYNLSKSRLQDVILRFSIHDTNGAGNLRIIVNNHVLENRVFVPGDYQIKIPPEFIENNMLIELSAESSYWKIWSPTVYVIEDASLTFTSYFEDAAQFKIYLTEEYLNMEMAKLDLVFVENTGTLIVDINGRNIWNSPVSDLQTIRVDKANLRLGDNIIKFSSGENSKFMGRGTFVIIFLTRYPELINETGIITAVQPLNGQSSQFYA